ncbi:asparagine synthase-related protein [Microbacterium horticulturae]|uniref:Asparagine synthase-related protein n=1 Tax=Microbacterium horticulturae TaxID=3028316 RepID=A0ABY8BYC1_9MICO|nr:asparagine synthase-related protein [Microbacterium sp. KACC 23027]WEG09169.1 asparagine synthase-related protein [Microbacterium sp. KACC 23027]
MTEFIRLDDDERIVAFPRPSTSGALVAWSEEKESPRHALEELIRERLESGPCYVLFSGGRDSSGILATAVAVARRIGVEDPIPVSVRFPGAPDSIETEWQELVLEYLDVNERIVFELGDDQTWLSEGAQRSLRRNGLLWPAAVHVWQSVFESLSGGSLLTGENGDMVLSGRRITPLIDAMRTGHPRRALRALRWISDDRKRSAQSGRMLAEDLPWLTSEGRQIAASYRWPIAPLNWSRALAAVVASRPARLVDTNLSGMIASNGLIPLHPLGHPRFVSALCGAGGLVGLGDRTAMMRSLFAGLLPDAVLARSSKASFDQTRWGPVEREFVQTWSGLGVSARFIDSDRLRDTWMSERPGSLSELHLHAAWLAQNNLPLVPHGS